MTEARSLAARFLQQYNDDEARDILERYRWPEGIRCPRCNSRRPIYKESRSGRAGYYRCPANHAVDDQGSSNGPLVFTVRTETILARSRLPLSKWLYCLARVSPEKITATELEARIDITRKTAARLLKLLRSLERDATAPRRFRNPRLQPSHSHFSTVNARPSGHNKFLVRYIIDNQNGWSE